jgi:putative membrane protein
MGLLIRGLVTAVAIAITAWVINLYDANAIKWGLVDYGLGDVGRYLSLFFTAIVLGIVNAFVRPILLMISLPLTCATLGLFVLVINALMLLLVSAIPQLGFSVNGFIPALVGSILISIVSGLLSKVVH